MPTKPATPSPNSFFVPHVRRSEDHCVQSPACYNIQGQENEEPEFFIDEDAELYGSGNEYEADDKSEAQPSPLNSRRSTFTGTPQWPQSFGQSMDMHAYMISPASFDLISSNITRLGSSFISSSQKRLSFLPETIGSLTQPLRSKGDKSSIPKVPSTKSISPTNANYDVKYPDAYGCNFLQATLNGMNVLAGVGVLSTPFAIKEGGWMGLLFLLFLSIVCCYTGILLRQCLDSSPGLETYPDIGQAAFGTMGRLIISIILYLELYACCVEFLILEGDNLAALFPWVHLDLGGFQVDAHKAFVCLAALFVLPTVYLRDLSLLSYISGAGVIASMLVMLCVFWVGAIDHVGFIHNGPLINLTGLPMSIGLYGFCYSGHAVFPNIYSSLRNPAEYDHILKVSFLLCTILYCLVAVMGYTMFGQDTKSQITLSLPTQYTASKIALWTIVVNPFTKYPLQHLKSTFNITPVALSLEELLPSKQYTMNNYSFWASIAIRTGLVFSTVIVALSIPFFVIFHAMWQSVILPCACYMSIGAQKIGVFEGIACVAIIMIGILCASVGTYSATSEIIHNLLS
ncbi:hypothetical protein O6H91_17G072900 [Diphasiastrum complanatum]|uniref:Uncharacterized protein n=1 Tax=Diphasiastrum complanatum TaxID=34168 RepID=A0ACC2B7Z8_DIPCM|nr:hypothetical protein O6H91_17G072900 [Diphasiastrum complanatum]